MWNYVYTEMNATNNQMAVHYTNNTHIAEWTYHIMNQYVNYNTHEFINE